MSARLTLAQVNAALLGAGSGDASPETLASLALRQAEAAVAIACAHPSSFNRYEAQRALTHVDLRRLGWLSSVRRYADLAALERIEAMTQATEALRCQLDEARMVVETEGCEVAS